MTKAIISMLCIMMAGEILELNERFVMAELNTNLVTKRRLILTPYDKARNIVDRFVFTGFKSMMTGTFVQLMKQMDKGERERIMVRLDHHIETLKEKQSSYVEGLTGFQTYLRQREEQVKLKHEGEEIDVIHGLTEESQKETENTEDLESKVVQKVSMGTQHIVGEKGIKPSDHGDVELDKGAPLKLRSRLPSIASRDIVDYFETGSIHKVNVEQLQRYHFRLSPRQQEEIRDRLYDLYFRLSKTQLERARRVKDIHTSLVDKHVKNEPVFSYAIAPQQPHADERNHAFFDDVPSQLKAAQMILDAGGDILKLAPNLKHLRRQNINVDGYENRLDQVIDHPLYREIFDLDYRVMMLWAHGTTKGENFRDGLSEIGKQNLYDEFYHFTSKLLKIYSGSGKTFMIGNWEGDWLLMGGTPDDHRSEHDAVPREHIDGMIEWMNIRAQAIHDAKTKVKHKNVNVYLYCELNHVNIQRQQHVDRVVNAVLPYIKVDYVSISSYDSQGLLSFGRAKDEAERREMIFSALDYVEDHLPPSEVKGKRVFVGEIGYPVYNVKKFYKMEEGEAQQALMALQNAVINLEWGMPFWIWWALYDNEEISEEDPTYRGFGCFDQVNERERMIFSEFKTFYTWAKNWERKNIRTKTSKNVKFRKDGIQQLRSQIQLLLTKAPASGRRPFRQRS